MTLFEKGSSHDARNSSFCKRGILRRLLLPLFVILLVLAPYALDVLKSMMKSLAWTEELISTLPIGTIRWFECDQERPGVECGTIIVPLDYFNVTKGTAAIALARYKATVSPKKGTVFLNPGGPGGSGTRLANSHFASLVGPDWDLVGFDPRGIGKTTPTVQCFPSPMSRQIFIANTVFEQAFSVSSNLSDPSTRNHLVSQYREFLAMKKTQAELCATNMGDDLRYMGTATVVRDIDFMSKRLEGEDALINYWGGSYGTILGAYLVNMLPHRVGRVVIDGVANPVLWAGKPSHFWHRDWLSSTEDTYKIFLETCSEADAGPKSCPLVKHQGEDPEAIESRIDKFLDRLYAAPLPVPHARRPGYLTSGAVKAILLIFMESPRLWPQAAAQLAEAMAGNDTSLLNLLLPSYSGGSLPEPDLSIAADLTRLAVTCLDSPPPADESEFPTPELLADIGLDTIKDVSRHFGMSTTISEPDGGCQFWPVTGPERFTGPWNHTLRNPILIVSNTADPVTPIASGRLVNSLLANSSRLLIVKSPGHCSVSLASLCAIKAGLAYFKDGTLPPNGHICEVDETPFPTPEGARMAARVMSAEDLKLIEAARQVSKYKSASRLHNIVYP